MPQRDDRTPFYLLTPPYDALIHSTGRTAGPDHTVPRGTALVWDLGVESGRNALLTAASRPGGLAMIVILPPAERLAPDADLLNVVERTRPQSILPFQPVLDPYELAAVLRRPPVDLPLEFTDYLSWRGLRLDGETRHLVRRTVELSDELRTITGLSRAVYTSRRALGRRFLSRGLPVPSHWLHFARVLRATIQLQNGSDSLFSVACDLGYPDGFALSNQMMRLTGVRPSTARECLGWEWLVESWLRRETADGGLSAPLRARPDAARDSGWGPTAPAPSGGPWKAAAARQRTKRRAAAG